MAGRSIQTVKNNDDDGLFVYLLIKYWDEYIVFCD